MSAENTGGGYQSTKEGTVFRDGKLYLFSPGEITVIRGWPEPLAWRKDVDQPWWRHVLPAVDFRALRVSLSKTESQSQASLRPSFRAWLSFWDQVPLQTRRLLGQFTNCHWQLLQLSARCLNSQDLMDSNPGLAFMLANSWAFRKPEPRSPLTSVRSLLFRKRREIARWLGFPSTESTVRIVGKLAPNSCSIRELLWMRRLMGDPFAVSVLRHMTRLNSDSVAMLSFPNLRPVLTPTLVAEAGSLRKGDRHQNFTRQLSAIVELTKLSGLDHIPRIRSSHHLQIVHQNLVEQSRYSPAPPGKNVFLPPPPFPGVFNQLLHLIPLMTDSDFVEESVALQHCLGERQGYLHQAALGCLAVYRGLRPERFTVVLQHQGLSWTLDEIRGKGNSPTKASTVSAVQGWLDGHQSGR